jgi:hypothetical protein
VLTLLLQLTIAPFACGILVKIQHFVECTCYLSSIVTIVRIRRPEWAGRLVRMSDDRAVKEVFLTKPDGRRQQEDHN